MNMNIDDAPNSKLVEVLAALQAEISDLSKAADAIKSELRRRAKGAYGTQVYGDLVLKVTPNRRFDAELAKKVLPTEVYQSILVPTPSSKLAKAVLTPAKYRAVMKEYDPKIQVAFWEDDDD